MLARAHSGKVGRPMMPWPLNQRCHVVRGKTETCFFVCRFGGLLFFFFFSHGHVGCSLLVFSLRCVSPFLVVLRATNWGGVLTNFSTKTRSSLGFVPFRLQELLEFLSVAHIALTVVKPTPNQSKAVHCKTTTTPTLNQSKSR